MSNVLRPLALCCLLCCCLASAPAPASIAEAGAGARASTWESRSGKSEPRFRGEVERLSPKLRRRMTGVSWHRGCPVGLGKLRLITARYRNFDGEPRRGKLVVHEQHGREVLGVLGTLWRKGFPIRRMDLIDRYDGSDHASMAKDNTSGFNCRFVSGTSRWSMHAYGKAIDINPRENPYVSGDFVSPPEGAPYAKRKPRRKGMLFGNGAAVRAMERIGWEWGGRWSNPTDYQHFSSNGE